jgi:hypothetical protein
MSRALARGRVTYHYLDMGVVIGESLDLAKPGLRPNLLRHRMGYTFRGETTGTDTAGSEF